MTIHDSEELRRDARDLLVAGDVRGAVSRLQAAVAFGVADFDVDVAVSIDLVRAYLAAGRVDDAVNLACDTAETDPRRSDVREVLIEAADAALRRRRFQAAEWAGESLTVVAPHDSAGWSRLVAARRKLGDRLAFERTLRAWVEDCPHDQEAVFLLRAHQGEWADAAPPESVRRLFDRYAPEFDEHLTQLGYRAPQEVVACLAGALAGRTGYRCADLGCGTGLVGPLVRAHVGHLVGVDLSPGMLAVASGRACYDELVEGELVAFLRERPASFDVLVSADTLNYLGDLRPVFATARAALSGGGLFVFTLEAGDDLSVIGYRLNDTGRFKHDPGDVERLLGHAAFAAVVERAVLRREGNDEVTGLIVTATAV